MWFVPTDATDTILAGEREDVGRYLLNNQRRFYHIYVIQQPWHAKTRVPDSKRAIEFGLKRHGRRLLLPL